MDPCSRWAFLNNQSIIIMKTKQEIILSIAKDWFDVDTLERRNVDALDFYTVSVTAIERALNRAFEEGQKAGGKL